MKNLLQKIKALRQRWFYTAFETRCAIAVAQQMEHEKVEVEREAHKRAALKLIEWKLTRRISKKVIKVECEFDEQVFSIDSDFARSVVCREVADCAFAEWDRMNKRRN